MSAPSFVTGGGIEKASVPFCMGRRRIAACYHPTSARESTRWILMRSMPFTGPNRRRLVGLCLSAAQLGREFPALRRAARTKRRPLLGPEGNAGVVLRHRLCMVWRHYSTNIFLCQRGKMRRAEGPHAPDTQGRRRKGLNTDWLLGNPAANCPLLRCPQCRSCDSRLRRWSAWRWAGCRQ